MTSRLQFAKMHGLGNDFMVLDLVTQEAGLDPDGISFGSFVNCAVHSDLEEARRRVRSWMAMPSSEMRLSASDGFRNSPRWASTRSW